MSRKESLRRRTLLSLGLAGLVIGTSSCSARAVEVASVSLERPQPSSGAVSTQSLVDQRSDSLFTILLTSGEVVEFADSYGESWETAWRFTYEGYLDRIRAHLIRVTLIEGGSYLLIGATRGDTTVVDSRPVSSPTAERFITTSIAGEAGFDPSRIQIWRVTPDGFSLEFSHETDDWGFSDAVWQREDSITVARHTQTDEVFPGTIRHPLSIIHRAGTWVLSEPPPGSPR